MLTNENIAQVMEVAKANSANVSMEDLVYYILSDVMVDKERAFRLSHGKDTASGIDAYLLRPGIKALGNALKPFGVGLGEKVTISREENQAALISMLDEIDKAMRSKEIERGQALKMMADIRVKLQDKFDMEDDRDQQKHIIVVPQKHDMICPHTNRECSNMPSKEACIKYYNLKEKRVTINDV